jgi:phage repressor protein C with HTH and peptisase S24 domain
MVPTLRNGDVVLVARVRGQGRAGLPVRPGDVVVGMFRARPDLLVVKRAIRPSGTGWWLRSDNEAVTDDSRRYGDADVVGKVVCRYWPPRRAALIVGRRTGA